MRDDEKFIPDSIWCFENSQLAINTYYCVNGGTANLVRLKDKRVRCVSENEASRIIKNVAEVDVICLHSLYSLPLNLIPQIPSSIKVVWYSWGYDIYNNPLPFSPLINDRSIYLPKTLECVSKYKYKRTLKQWVKLSVSYLRLKAFSPDLLNECINRVDFFAGVFPLEYDLLKEAHGSFRAVRISHNYIHPQEFKECDIVDSIEIRGNNIQLCHSACFEDNHIDVMPIIADAACDYDAIICPLSYSGTHQYVDAVIEKGKYYFGDKFKPLVDFMSFDEYCKIQNSCNRFILGSIRQQATCNCLTSMWSGMKLIMFPQSINYQQYIDFGLNVYNIESSGSLISTIDNSTVISNREIISGIYSYDSWKQDLKDFIALLS